MGRFKASRLIASQSWALLKQDKEILLFPILSVITSLVVFVLLFLLIVGVSFSDLVSYGNGVTELKDVLYIFPIICYIISFFIVNFFESGIFVVAHSRFNGQNLSFYEGIRISFSKIGKILAWSLISATVGVILNFISEKSEIIGKILVAILGAAWEIMTYFSLPSLIIGNTSVTGAFKESAQIIRKVWGETFIVGIGAGLFFSGIILIAVLVAVFIVYMVPKLIFVCGALLLMFVFAISVISSALNSIFKLVIYEYARTGVVPNGFSQELIKTAIKSNRVDQISDKSSY